MRKVKDSLLEGQRKRNFPIKNIYGGSIDAESARILFELFLYDLN